MNRYENNEMGLKGLNLYGDIYWIDLVIVLDMDIKVMLLMV